MKQVTKDHFNKTVLKMDITIQTIAIGESGLYKQYFKTRNGEVIGKAIERRGGSDEEHTEEDFFTNL